MKTIIVDMKDLSDSVEVYESKPNPFLVYTIYVIFGIMLVAIIWASIFEIDDEVKSSGVFKGSDEIYDISSGVRGKIIKCNVENGTYVEEGDLLYSVSIDNLSETITSYQESLSEAEDRLEMLDAYELSLDSGTGIDESLSNNKYYKEFVDRRELILSKINSSTSDSQSQSQIYQENIDSINSAIEAYNEKIEKLGQVKNCITNRENTFNGSEDSYYRSLVSSYIASYNYNKLQYDNKISDYQNQINALKKEIKKAEEGTDVSDLQSQIDTLNSSITSAQTERDQALLSIEQSQISSLEQMIENYNDSLITLESNLSSAKSSLNGVSTSSDTDDIAILTEKGNIASERLTYKDKKNECEDYLKSYNIQDDNCAIVAKSSGYFYVSQDLKVGSYLQEGSEIGSIYPESESGFYAEIYVENSDIGRIKEGQEVKFEISAFPSSEYGYFTGDVESIAKNITVDENTGAAYYIVKVKCQEMNLSNKDGDSASLKNGMACTGKIVIGEKTVMQYLLEKINLLD
ncbi:MAG: HlyD family efflux transporter periplasmic adaptor subunit [Lachnospiraceae bacterium]|nr:HlyD family efflux transporter periplasmic adaptor subunit [Lachnospiraceae bacterium]